MKNIILSLVATSFLLGILILPMHIVLAQVKGAVQTNGATGETVVEAKIDNPFKFGDKHGLLDYLQAIIDNIIIPIGGILAVLAFIYSGFLYVTAQGNESQITQAHKALLYTAIGTAVLLGSAAAAKVIQNTISQLQ